MRSLIRFSAILISVIAFANVVSAEVYKWVDDKGKVHFGDRPPSDVDAKTLDMPKPKPNSTPSVSDQERKQRQQRLIRALQEERKEKERKQAEQEEKQAKHLAACKRLQAEVKDSKRVSSYYRYNEKGEREYMSDKDADRYRQELADEYEAKCAELLKK